jgi:hypothetical protein
MDVGAWISSAIALLALATAVAGLVYAARSAAAAEDSAAYGRRRLRNARPLQPTL